MSWTREVPAGRGALAAGLFWTTYFVWVGLEVWLRIRDDRHPSPSHGNEDRGTQRLFALAIVAGIGLGLAAPSELPGARIARGMAIVVVGVVLAWLGLVLRVWAIHTLGRYFRRSVTIEQEHALVTTGPYRVLRHPSYTGTLLIGFGLGVATGNVASLVGFFAIPLAGILVRVTVEERALTQALDDEYVGYRARTSRLVPGLW
jgi:protein-S-isoprenylcysteine O-methyltransferase